MKITTKLFGEIEAAEDKIIEFSAGIIGFPKMQHFLLIHDIENEKSRISWLQSVEEPEFAMPVIDPLVEDEMLSALGDLDSSDMLVLVTVTVPADIRKMTANFKAPVIINAANQKACQIIVEDEKYEVKHPVYDLLTEKKED